MSDIDRRTALKLLGVMAAAPTFSVACSTPKRTGAEGTESASTAPDPESYEHTFLSDHEFETVSVLVDWIIPADERSGSATDAGVPAFIDFTLTDDKRPNRDQAQRAFRGGLAWIEYECIDRFGAPFVDCTEKQQQTLLDAIAWPEQADPSMKPGVEFFNSLRDLASTGFFTSKMGVKDLQYRGNKAVGRWTGCPENVLKHVGVRA
ncbi:MAG: gluconate 2-dehydrogenase subunit 3 family protein [Salinibacter sp.]